MSTNALPMLFYNLGGEMLYVLDQRLRAQSVPMLKGKKVMADIVSTMFSKNFVGEIFKPQGLYSRNGLRTMFERLVHSSIMRVDADSMEKLYDLMVMTFKYQIIMCKNPRDLLHVTLNHMDAILEFVSSSPEAKALVLQSFRRTVSLYEGMSIGELIRIKQLLLNFLHDSKNRVSVFVNSKCQNSDGTFVIANASPVPQGTEVPGTIFYFGDDTVQETFTTGAQFGPCKVKESSTSVGGYRSTRLGTNLYASNYSSEDVIGHDFSVPSNQGLAKAELGLLSHLMGASQSDEKDFFKLDLFGDKEEVLKADDSKATEDKPPSATNVVAIKAESSGNEELSRIVHDFDAVSTKQQTTSADDDLLSLMDST